MSKYKRILAGLLFVCNGKSSPFMNKRTNLNLVNGTALELPGIYGPKGLLEKSVTVRNEYKYHVACENAHEYDYFGIDGSEISNDIHIGLSKFTGHTDKKWEIVIGGWSGTQSVIRLRDATTNIQYVAQQHSKTFYERVRGNIMVKVSDGELMVRVNGEDFLQYRDDSIKKSELKYLLLSGGWGGQGTYKIVGAPIEGDGTFSISSSTYFRSCNDSSTNH